MDIEYNDSNMFDNYTEEQLDGVIDRFVRGELAEDEIDDFEEFCYLNREWHEKRIIAQAAYKVGGELREEVLRSLADKEDSGAILSEGYKSKITQAIKDKNWEESKALSEDALELWPSSPEFEQLLAQTVVAKQIQRLSGSDCGLFLRVGEDDLARFSMSSTSDEELEIEIPSACDISFVTEAGDVIYSRSLLDDNLFMVDEAAVRSASGDLESVEIWDDEPSFEEELFGGRIVVSVHRGNISGKLKIRLKASS